jgi:exportin-7
MLQLVQLEPSLFFRLVDALVHGMDSLDVLVANYCAAAMDSLATFHFRQMRKDTDVSRALNALMVARPETFANLLHQLFSIVFMTVCSNHWALGKPILSLMLASQESFQRCKHRLMETQPPEKRPLLDAAFNELISGIRPNLEQTNRDRFNQCVFERPRAPSRRCIRIAHLPAAPRPSCCPSPARHLATFRKEVVKFLVT